MSMLLFNAGSSGLKFSLLDPELGATRLRGEADWESSPVRYAVEREDSARRSEWVAWSGFEEAVERIVADLGGSVAKVEAVVHRMVHGGTLFAEPLLVTDAVRAALGPLSELAPLHVPPGLEVLDAARRLLPGTPHVLVFDTAFHASLAPCAYAYALPAEWSSRWGLRRFGFHGLSHAWAAGRAAEMLSRPTRGLRLVVAHLGSGASVTAVAGGRSVDTSMGFTPLEGLMMATRSGSVDPGLLLHLQRRFGVTVEALEHALYRESGWLGVSGVSSDFRRVLAAARDGHPGASLAFEMFVHRVRQSIGAMAATLGGVDALVFTGGIGENSPDARRAIAGGLGFLGLRLDADRNAAVRPDDFVSTADAPAAILVVEAREDLIMARGASALVREAAGVGAAPAGEPARR